MKNFNKPFTTPDGEVREDLTDAELEAMFSTAKRLDELPSSLQAKLRELNSLQAEALKEAITLPLSPSVVTAFKNTGAGWQTRIDAALNDWLKQHDPHSLA